MPRTIRRCRYGRCNARLIVTRDVQGKEILLDSQPTVYHLTPDMFGEEVAVEVENHYVHHFYTCKQPESFPKGETY